MIDGRWKQDRREFIKSVGLIFGALVVSLSGLFSKQVFAASALPAGKKAVPESDPVAKAIGYMQDRTKSADWKKKKATAESCANCVFYKKTDANWGECQMLAGKGEVAADGWCRSWQKKA